jgi:hypothetical protein
LYNGDEGTRARMFTEERKAVEDRNRAAVCWLIESIPASRWTYAGSPPHAEAWEESVGIVVHHVSGGTGIDTYDSVSLSILWPGGSVEIGGQYTAEEFRLPNYIPQDQRHLGGNW